MKKFLVHIIMIFSILTVFTTVTYAEQQPLSVIVNDKKIVFPDAQPFVDSNNRTQAPARFIAEELGATATWDGVEKKATFKLGNKVLVFYIGELNYTINGQVKQMDTTALLMDERTYVPAKYVAEAFGADVIWNSQSRTVYIKNINTTQNSNNTTAQTPTNGDNTSSETENDQELIKTKLSYTNDANKIYFLKNIKLVSNGSNVTNHYTEVYDKKNSTYTITLPASLKAFVTEEVLNINDSLVSTVKISRDKDTGDTHIVFNTKTEVRFYISYNEKQNESEISLVKPVKANLSYMNKYDRVYFALKGVQLASVGATITNYFKESYDTDNNKYTIILPASSKICLADEVIKIDDSMVSTVEICRDDKTNDTHIVFNTKKEFKFFISYNDKLKQSEINLLTPAKSGEKLVVIDAGHGGVDPGACKGTAYEKDINLAIALKLEHLLESKGINVFMLRQDDTFVGLYDRPYIANALNASLFLSIHNNSIDNSKVSGTETLYYPEKEGDPSFTGEKFAKIVQDSLISKLKTVNRKTVERPGLVVLKYTKMPAALSEIGFLTNPTDLKNLQSETFQKKTAEALCDAIVKSLEKL